MKVSTWLVIELRPKNSWNPEAQINAVITKARQTRPKGQMAIKVTLDIDAQSLQPRIEAWVDAGLIDIHVDEDAEA